MADISNNVRRLRRQRDMSQAQLADRLGVTRQTVSGWERGLTYPDLPMLEKLAEVFDTDLNGLLYPESRGEGRRRGEPLRARFVPLAMLLYTVLLIVGGAVLKGFAPGNDLLILWGLILLAGLVALCACWISGQIADRGTGEE